MNKCPGRSTPRNNFGQVVHTRAPVTKQYKLVPAQAGS